MLFPYFLVMYEVALSDVIKSMAKGTNNQVFLINV